MQPYQLLQIKAGIQITRCYVNIPSKIYQYLSFFLSLRARVGTYTSLIQFLQKHRKTQETRSTQFTFNTVDDLNSAAFSSIFVCIENLRSNKNFLANNDDQMVNRDHKYSHCCSLKQEYFMKRWWHLKVHVL